MMCSKKIWGSGAAIKGSFPSAQWRLAMLSGCLPGLVAPESWRAPLNPTSRWESRRLPYGPQTVHVIWFPLCKSTCCPGPHTPKSISLAEHLRAVKRCATYSLAETL